MENNTENTYYDEEQPAGDSQVSNLPTSTGGRGNAPLPATQGVGTPDRLIELALTHNCPIETLERLMAMRDKLNAEQAEKAFNEAMAAFQGEVPVIKKGKSAGQGNFKYNYAPLDMIVQQVQPFLKKNGLSYTFDTENLENKALKVSMVIHHVGGHSKSFSMTVPIDYQAKMNDTQKHGSARTYGQRYVFCGGFGILTGDTDDDGQSVYANGNGNKPPVQQPQRRTQGQQQSKPQNTRQSQPGTQHQKPKGPTWGEFRVLNVGALPTADGRTRYKIEMETRKTKMYCSTEDDSLGNELTHIASFDPKPWIWARVKQNAALYWFIDAVSDRKPEEAGK